MITRQVIEPAYVESGRILDVDMSTYTVSATTQYTKKPQSGIRFATPYQHFVNGEGIYFMPEVGSLCWICFPSDGNRPFVMAWAPAGEEGDYRSRRKELNPGDIYLGTRDENFLVLRRGGVVQIGGGPICQRIFLPINNTISDFCENYGLHTLGGDLEWTIGREEETTDGHRPARLKIKAKEFADDPKPIAELEIGSHEGSETTILSLVIRASGVEGADLMVGLKIDKEGNVEWEVKKDVTYTVTGEFVVAAEDNVRMNTQSDMLLEAKVLFSATGKDAELVAKTGKTTVKSPIKILLDAPTTHAGGESATQAVALAPVLLTWLALHTHKVIAPGQSTTPPEIPPPPAAMSTSMFAK